MYTNGPVENISFLGEPIATAVEHSGQRDSERARGATYTGCMAVLVPKDFTRDMSFNILINRDTGHKLIDFLGLQLKETPRLRLPDQLGLGAIH